MIDEATGAVASAELAGAQAVLLLWQRSRRAMSGEDAVMTGGGV
jgi:hypothetical protein